MNRRLFLPILLIISAFLTLSVGASSQSNGVINGVVKDQTGAVIVGAAVAVRNKTTNESRAATTDGEGKFSVANLPPGKYTVSISNPGFKTADVEVTVSGSGSSPIDIKLEIAETKIEVGVSAKGKGVANTDPNYRALRDATEFEGYAVSELTINRDVGTFVLHSGSVSFLPPVMGRVTTGVFVGEAEFTLDPVLGIERDHIHLITGKDSVSESFKKAVLNFTDETYQQIKKQAQPGGNAAGAKSVLESFRNRSRSQYTGDGENVDALTLASIYNPKRPGFFTAYIDGQKHNQLAFFVNPYGVFSSLGPEEVALVNLDFASSEGGFWYMSHFASEIKGGTASSLEDKRFIDVEHYKIETVIDGGENLTARADVTFTALLDGERMLPFGLLPSLRATRVAFGDADISFIQEKQKQDGSFFAVLPEPLIKGKKYTITIEYHGQKVLQDAGGGNFAVGARTSWYPSVNAFNDRATFDLTFKVPSKFTIVGVGKMVKEWKEGSFAASQWISELPLAVAGFNYGLFKRKDVVDTDTKYQIEGYATTELPSYLSNAEEQTGIGGMTPTRLTDNMIVEAQNSMRLFTAWFGAAPYGRIALTQQPQPNFGQSWPTLVYLPIIAFFDSTQRYALQGGISSRGNEFVDEVCSHEVAHQWWGHMVGWASYHDQWLSEGFAHFSAGLYLQATEKTPDKYLHFYNRLRDDIIQKNQFGIRPTDAGPIWLGLRLNTFKTRGAYRNVVYPKGAYILHMLRMMMHDVKTGDEKFIAMMKDFVQSHFNKNASTESFKQVVEKHMTPKMDLEGNHRMDWFFREWVYGTQVPRYKMEYTLTPGADGKFLLKGNVTQSEVSENFAMIVPIYLDFDGKIARLGQLNVFGAKPSDFEVMLPKKPKRVLLNYQYDVLAAESSSSGK